MQTAVARELPGKSRDDLQVLIAADLNLLCGITPYQSNVPGPAEQFSLYGAEFWYHATLHSGNRAQLVIINAGKVSSSILEEQRERAYVPVLTFKFGQPRDLGRAKNTLLNLREGLERHQAEVRAQEIEQREQELFRTWAAILKLKNDLERKKEQPIAYTTYTIENNRASFTLATTPDEELIGQTRLVNSDKSRLLRGVVEDVQGDKLVLYIETLYSDELPSSGSLTFDISAAEEALHRQRLALDSVRFDRVLRADLRHLLIHPDRAGHRP